MHLSHNRAPRRALPRLTSVLLVGVTVLIALRAAQAMSMGTPPMVVARTYVFWALVCGPVAYVGDTVVRTVSQYRIVRLVAARVRARR